VESESQLEIDLSDPDTHILRQIYATIQINLNDQSMSRVGGGVTTPATGYDGQFHLSGGLCTLNFQF